MCDAMANPRDEFIQYFYGLPLFLQTHSSCSFLARNARLPLANRIPHTGNTHVKSLPIPYSLPCPSLKILHCGSVKKTCPTCESFDETAGKEENNFYLFFFFLCWVFCLLREFFCPAGLDYYFFFSMFHSFLPLANLFSSISCLSFFTMTTMKNKPTQIFQIPHNKVEKKNKGRKRNCVFHLLYITTIHLNWVKQQTGIKT